jgi:hypothetical protein
MFRELLSGEGTARERIGVVILRWEAAFVALLLVLLGLPGIALGADTNLYDADPGATEHGKALNFGSGCASCESFPGEGAIDPGMLDDRRAGIVQR